MVDVVVVVDDGGGGGEVDVVVLRLEMKGLCGFRKETSKISLNGSETDEDGLLLLMMTLDSVS